MPQSISIDNYLHTHADNEKIVTIGKLGIAASILEAEINSVIYCDPRKVERIIVIDPQLANNVATNRIVKHLIVCVPQPQSDIAKRWGCVKCRLKES